VKKRLQEGLGGGGGGGSSGKKIWGLWVCEMRVFAGGRVIGEKFESRETGTEKLWGDEGIFAIMFQGGFGLLSED